MAVRARPGCRPAHQLHTHGSALTCGVPELACVDTCMPTKCTCVHMPLPGVQQDARLWQLT